MPLEIVTIPCLSDNYAFLAHDPVTNSTALIDAPEAEPILKALDTRGWTLDQVLITHHHGDHVDGLAAIRAAYDVEVIGHKADAARLPDLDRAVSEGDQVSIGNETGEVLEVSGHTVGHIAFFFPGTPAVFTADSLMALGCGRVFEGTFAQMWASLSKLAALPPETLVCSGHEYTAANGRFALTVDPDNPALSKRVEDVARANAAGQPTVPSRLDLELATNPFLRADDPSIRAHLGLQNATSEEVFAEIRRRKDAF